MAPLRQPSSLQSLCIDKGSQFIVSNAVFSHDFSFPMQWEKLCIYVENFIPPVVKGNLFHCALKKLAVEQSSEKITPEAISCILRLLIHPVLKQLSFSDLIYAGDTSYETLDTFEYVLGKAMPYLPSLTYLDLSTHKTEVTLPSCSYYTLLAIGQNCPNLRVLDLNNNNRVTGECLECLAPTRYSRGCPFLEEIFIQDCSVLPGDIVWLLQKFRNLRIVSYPDMGIILQRMSRKRRCNRRYQEPLLNLTHIDNTESTCGRTDRDIIRLIQDMCPYAENVKLRMCDEDCVELSRLSSVTKLELRFYTGVHHHIGANALNYFRQNGYLLTALTIYCDELESFHVCGIATKCINLVKLFLHSNYFYDDNHSFKTSPNVMAQLEVLSIRIGQHEMVETPAARCLVEYLVYPCFHLKEIYLLVRCVDFHHNMFIHLLNNNPLSYLHTLICDAPRRNLGLPMIPLGVETALMIIEACFSLTCIGNLISWQIPQNQIEELKGFVRNNNYNVDIIYSLSNKMNKKYF